MRADASRCNASARTFSFYRLFAYELVPPLPGPLGMSVGIGGGAISSFGFTGSPPVAESLAFNCSSERTLTDSCKSGFRSVTNRRPGFLANGSIGLAPFRSSAVMGGASMLEFSGLTLMSFSKSMIFLACSAVR